MLLIYINNRLADTDGVSFIWTRKSPVMSVNGNFESDFVYNINFKATDVNTFLFEMPLRFSRVNKKALYDIRCVHFGTEIFTGDCQIESANQEHISTSSRVGSGSFYHSLEGKMLNDRIYKYYPIPVTPYDKNMVKYAFDVVEGKVDVPFCFPKILAEEFYGSDNEDFGGDMGNGTVGKYLNNWIDQSFHRNEPVKLPFSRNVYSMIPFVNLHWVLEKIFKSLNYTAEGKFLTDSDYSKIYILNNTPLDCNGENRYSIKASKSYSQAIHGDDIHIIYDIEDEDPDLCFENSFYRIKEYGNYRVVLNFEINFIDALIVDISCLTSGNREIFFTKLGAPSYGVHTFEIERYGDVKSNELGEKLRIEMSCDDNVIIQKAWITIENVSQIGLNMFSREIDVQKHLPNIELKKFLSSIFYRFGITPIIDNEKRQIKLIYFSDIISNPKYTEFSDNITQLPRLKKNDITGIKLIEDTPGINKNEYSSVIKSTEVKTPKDMPGNAKQGDIAMVTLSQSLYKYTRDLNNNIDWVFLGFVKQDYTIGTQFKSINKNISVPFQSSDGLFPDFRQKANSELFKTQNDSELQLLYYHGLVEDPEGNLYPHASPYVFSYDGMHHFTEKSLILNSAEGVIFNHLQPWLDHAINTKPVVVKKLMTSKQIKKIKFQNKIKIEGIEYIIIRINAPISNQYLIEAELELETV